MNAVSSKQMSDVHSDNPKFAIQNRKWAGIFTIAFAFGDSDCRTYRAIVATLMAVFCLVPIGRAESQDERAKQIEAARKEGRFAWYTATNLTESKPLLNDFEKQYPFIQGEIF